MKKTISTFLVILTCAVCLNTTAFADEDTPIVIIVDGVSIKTDAETFLEQGEVMVPVKNIAEALGFRVTGWDAYRAFIHDEVNNIQLIADLVGGSSARMSNAGDGRRKGEIDNSVPPMKVGDHIYVPLRSFADAFDYDVHWDESAKTATLINQLDTSFLLEKRLLCNNHF